MAIDPTIIRQIKADAAEAHPKNYSGQDLYIDVAQKAYVALQEYKTTKRGDPMYESLRRTAKKLFGRGYLSQLRMIEAELAAAHAFSDDAQFPGVPADELRAARKHALRLNPDPDDDEHFEELHRRRLSDMQSILKA